MPKRVFPSVFMAVISVATDIPMEGISVIIMGSGHIVTRTPDTTVTAATTAPIGKETTRIGARRPVPGVFTATVTDTAGNGSCT